MRILALLVLVVSSLALAGCHKSYYVGSGYGYYGDGHRLPYFSDYGHHGPGHHGYGHHVSHHGRPGHHGRRPGHQRPHRRAR